MIKIICVGKLKENYWKDAINEYLKRISKFTKITLIEVNDFASGDILKRESEEIIKHINNKDYIIVMDIQGRQLDSLAFAKTIDNVFIHNSNITMIIGGSYGLDQSIKNIANMFRVMLLEQIYRSYKINQNEEYHK